MLKLINVSSKTPKRMVSVIRQWLHRFSEWVDNKEFHNWSPPTNRMGSWHKLKGGHLRVGVGRGGAFGV